ncbi:MAG: PAS domain S-box protein [Candidatus Methanoperedens sp.]|nr:PAS domain S-box protein [Candidatus Methanoperedens sp.]
MCVSSGKMKGKTKGQLIEELNSLKERLSTLENADIERKKVIKALSESEAKYRLLFDSAPVGIGIADLEGNIIDANKNMQEMSGFSLDEYRAIGVGATYADLEERKLLLDSLREKGKVRDWEGRLKRKDGSEYYALINADIMELKGRKVLLAIIRDISQIKRNEVALNAALAKAQEEKNKSEAIIAALGDGIIIQDTGYKIIYQNYVQNDLFGNKTGELCYKAYEGKEKICDDCPVERTFRDGKIHRSERKVSTDKGDFYYDLTSSPLRDSKGKIIAGIKVVREITGQKRLEQTLRESEEKYRRLVETLMEGIWVLDKDGNTTFVNPRMAQMLGYTVDEMLGKHVFSFMDEQEKENAMRYLERRSQGVKGQYDFEFIRKDGTKIYTSLETSPITDENGKYSGAVAAIADITERKRTEEKLRKGEKFLESIYSSIQDGIGIIDKGMNIISANKTAESWYPHAVPLIGKKCYEAYHQRKERCELCPAWETLKTGKAAYREVARHGPGGKQVGWVEIYSYPLNDMITGQMNGVIEYVRDITKRKHMEEQLKQSEEKYRNLVELTTDIIYLTDKKRNHIFMNDAGLRILEALPGEVIGHHWSKYIYPEDREKSFQKFREMIENGTDVFDFENRYISKSGKVINVLHNIRILRNENGEVTGTQGIARDITERERSEEALRLSNLVVENSQTVLFRWRAEEGWPVDFVSNNIVQFGYSAEEFLSGALLYESIIHHDDLERVSRQVHEHSKSGDDRLHQEYRIIAKNGSVHWVDDRTVIEREKNGNITHYQGIIIDITERKHTEEAIRKYNKELVESNRMKELFTDIMHHDLLNPLNVANGYVELFLEDEKNPRKKSYLNTIKRNLVKGMELIDNATKLSKLKSLESIGFKDLDLKIVVTEVIENLTPLAVNAGMRIENNLETRLPVKANRIIEDIFINIIINAIKYAPQGKRIVVKGTEEANSCSVRIIDFGEGIKDPEKKLIFERFNRNEKKGVKGSGLGLAIAGRIVELHNGRIRVEDNPEGGAVFVVEIPKS